MECELEISNREKTHETHQTNKTKDTHEKNHEKKKARIKTYKKKIEAGSIGGGGDVFWAALFKKTDVSFSKPQIISNGISKKNMETQINRPRMKKKKWSTNGAIFYDFWKWSICKENIVPAFSEDFLIPVHPFIFAVLYTNDINIRNEAFIVVALTNEFFTETQQ